MKPMCILLMVLACLPGRASERPEIITNSHNLNFEANKGQWPAQVQFKTDVAPGHQLFLEKDRFTYSVFDPRQLNALHDASHEKNQSILDEAVINLHAFYMKFVGSNPSCVIRANDQKPYYYNYFIGADRANWAEHVPAFSEVEYLNLYNSIDLKAYQNAGRFKYDYILKPGADLSSIQLNFEGVNNLSIKDSHLCIVTSVVDIVESIPYAYQLIDGKEVKVECQYRIDKTTQTVGFYLPNGYDKRYTLVIDPVLMAATYSGSIFNTYGHCATYDVAGNIYTGGRVFGQGYPTTTGAFQGTFGGGTDIGISKLNPTGSALIYATYIGGISYDFPHSLFVDGSDNLFVFGTSQSGNYPVTTGAFDVTGNGGDDIVISKLNSAGVMLASTYVGGSGSDGRNLGASYNYGDDFRGEIIADNTGDIYVSSCSTSLNFPVTTGAYDLSQNGGQDAVLFKMNSALTSMLWSTYIGGSLNDAGFSLRRSSNGEIFVAGVTEGSGFPASPTALNSSPLGNFDGFLARFNSSGSTLVNSTFIGTAQKDLAYFVELDYLNTVYVYGVSEGSMPISANTYSNPGSHNYIMRLNSSLNSTFFSTVIGGGSTGQFSPSAFMVDRCLDIYISGWGNVFNYPVTPNALQNVPAGGDFYLGVLKSNASSLSYATYFGSSAGEHVDGGTSRFDPRGIVYQAICEFGSSLMPTTPTAFCPNKASGAYDIAVFKVDFQSTCGQMNKDTAICYGSTATISIPNPDNLTNPTYSFAPGGISTSNSGFTVAPSSTSTYTMYINGTNATGALATNSGIATVSVMAMPFVSPSFTQASCTSTANGFDLGLTFQPAAPPQAYNITWAALPNGIYSPTQTIANGGITAGNYDATITAGMCVTTVSFNIKPVPPPVSFYTNNIPVITCSQPTINLTANPPAYSYTWSNGPWTYTGTSVSLAFPHTGNWTVTATDLVTGCTNTLGFAVTQNTSVSSSTLQPNFQNITCSLSSVTTITAIANPVVNINHYWVSPFGGTLTAATATSYFVPGGPGTYTHIAINTSNGCSTIKTFTVASNFGFPTFSVTSPQNYTLGCGTKSVANINVASAQTTPPGGAVSYALIGPPTGTNYTTGNISSYTVSVPGNWTVITQDDVSLCQTKVQVTVIQNTLQPNISVVVPNQVLSCDIPTVTLEGRSNTDNTSYHWVKPGPVGVISGNTITIETNPLAVTNTLVGNYTLNVTDNNNTCVSQSVIPVYQNIIPPLAKISGNNLISCKVYSVLLTNQSSSRVPSFFGISLPVIGYLWKGPSPQQDQQVQSTYMAYLPGDYSLTAKDLNNGCISNTVFTVNDGRLYPQEVSGTPFLLECASPGATIYPSIAEPFTNYAYDWMAVPDASFSSYSQRKTIVNRTGVYGVIVTNTVSGCAINTHATVVEDTLTARFEPGTLSGFAPLDVAFINNSSSGSKVNGTDNIRSVWNFGNSDIKNTNSTLNVSTRYIHPGTYTVTLYVAKGECFDTTVRIISVEFPSLLEIPNVFTPNGDNVNDVFFVRANGMAKISALIYDRWGNKVYDLKNSPNNIAWDGKTPQGREAADGTYYYIINAEGNDGKIFQKKGTLSLFR